MKNIFCNSQEIKVSNFELFVEIQGKTKSQNPIKFLPKSETDDPQHILYDHLNGESNIKLRIKMSNDIEIILCKQKKII